MQPWEKRSALGADWHPRDIDERTQRSISQKHDLPDLIATLLLARSVDEEQIDGFLTPTLKDQLPDPSHLLDMDKAVEAILATIDGKQNITVFGDYDVDGATSSALLIRYFRTLGIEITYYIPDRVEEGYGPNVAAFEALHKQGTNLIITVDCGTVADAPITRANELGMQVIVIDHHLGAESLPPAAAVVNPNRMDESSPHRNLAAVGVTFLLVIALNRALRERGHFEDTPEPNPLQWLDLVALGTVCDVMPLKGLNRAYVAQGIKNLAARQNPGLRALCDVGRIDEPPAAYHLGFVLGPRINAGGRVGKSDLGTRLLTTENSDEAWEIAQELDRYNKERQAIEKQVQEEAEAQLNDNARFNVVAAEGWHQGVIGIVASRLKEKTNKPSAVIALEGGIGKGSARSVTGVDVGAAITEARMQGLLNAGGGHAMAGGFSLEEGKITDFTNYLEDKLGAAIQTYLENTTRHFDATIHLAGITMELANQLEMLEPFGTGHREPTFLLPYALPISVDLVGTDHLRCILTDGSPTPVSKLRLKAMAFRAAENPLGAALLKSKGKPIHLIGRLKRNRWQGNESIEFHISDAISA